MIGRFLRVLFGFVVACLAGGLTVVLFVYTPFEMSDLQGERLAEVGIMSLAAATQSALFSAPFALIGAVFAEWQRIGSWLYYVLISVAISALGFFAQFVNETGGFQGAIANTYAVAAFLIAGVVAGLAYWLFSGRLAAGDNSEPDILPPPRRTPPTNGPSIRPAT